MGARENVSGTRFFVRTELGREYVRAVSIRRSLERQGGPTAKVAVRGVRESLMCRNNSAEPALSSARVDLGVNWSPENNRHVKTTRLGVPLIFVLS